MQEARRYTAEDGATINHRRVEVAKPPEATSCIQGRGEQAPEQEVAWRARLTVTMEMELNRAPNLRN